MNESSSTNMVTVRTINGEQVVEINGRELPDVFLIERRDYPDHEDVMVTVQFHAAQYNDVKHGDPIALNTGNPRADKYLRVIFEAYTTLKEARWWQLFGALRQVRATLATIMETPTP